jgi:hypothetical protein
MILDRIPTRDRKISQLLSISLPYLTFFLLLTFSCPVTGNFMAVSPFFCGFLYFFIYGGRQTRGFMPVFWEGLGSAANLYAAYLATFLVLGWFGFQADLGVAAGFIMFYPIVGVLYFLFAGFCRICRICGKRFRLSRRALYPEIILCPMRVPDQIK